MRRNHGTNLRPPSPHARLHLYYGRVRCTKDLKVPNAMTMVIEREDHTLGNILRMQMLEDKEVLFSGYRVQHPLEPAIQVKVQTRSENPGSVQARARNMAPLGRGGLMKRASVWRWRALTRRAGGAHRRCRRPSTSCRRSMRQ